MIAAVVLAAGSSTRLRSTKQLLPLHGRPLVLHAVDAARDAGIDEILVVVGHEADRVAAALPEDVRAVANPEHRRGQSTSVRAGLEALGPDVEAVVVLLADQPGVRPEDLRALVEAFREGVGPVVRLRYADAPGPALLGREVWPEVRALVGDTGARTLLDAHPEWVHEIAVASPAPADVDTQEDLDRARALEEP